MTGQRGRRVVAGVTVLALPVLVVVLVVALGTTLWGRGDLNRFICDGDCGPSNVVPPEGLALREEPASAVPDATTAATGQIDPAKLAAAVDPALDDPALGSRVGFAAVSTDGTPIYAAGADRAYAPASTTKVLTAFAALSTIDPGTRFATTVVRSGDGIVLVGGGDPYLSTKPARRVDDRVFQADLTTLARRTAAALEASGTTSVTLGYDDSLFTGPDASPAWEPDYVTANIVTRVSALWVDQAVTNGVRAADPSADAARTFAGLLADRGVTVTGEPSRTVAAADAQPVGEVRSATIEQIVETLVRVSDNEAAEVVLRQLALASGRAASFDGGTEAVAAALTSAGIPTDGLKLGDGSGLSRDNRISPTTLVRTLQRATGSSRTSELLADLPVSGFTGTLVDRFAGLATARGSVRAKTGTLTGIHSLAGYAIDADGRPVLFAVMSDDSDRDQPLQAQAALDEVTAAIATCSCA
ncbi:MULTISPECIES: D-alanyl-D-alanine carboxypeptidase/D-alanyl-D-alanine-endopeptidase [Aeromicrobium]|uniref:D-alanyl-D-alanine carboxypeptidase/D-alanyl-D-alanine endopeptidase n=1 Tax=Aeromicrobium TaxID=2040 RepID=UPI0009E84603|nr:MULTISPECIES: D-alanyl-D-alanine carboxypeptidase/D-alanyl-D-alanine-endopeptidase [Aeromicrobium]MCL8251593.1 D-alanyl-D-alanine carboxypeptidase/D-alanyl-D-alanine-endopeptidase [Aeromicrobium fastidiosum]